jgi:uncharacterized protein with HEPN domain
LTLHDDGIRLHHMRDHAAEAVALAHGKARADLDRDRLLELGLVRLVEVVGEAASRVSEETRKRCPGIPWRQVCNMRNRLIHGYDTVDLDILWDVVQMDLPSLIAETDKALEGAGGGP